MADEILVERLLAPGPAEVFGFLTDQARYTRWMGRTAELDPRPGGIYRVAFSEEAVALGEYVAVEPPTRIVFTWGWVGSDVIPPGSSTVEITLEPQGGGTRLVLRHSGIEDAHQLSEHTDGWHHYLARLEKVSGGGDAAPEP